MGERKTGIWIAFEGNDGSGKTSQLKKYANFLREHGLDVVETREPGGNSYSEKLRSLIFDDEVADDGETQLLLFTAARRRNILTTILPVITSGRIALSDRSQGSTFAYQHYQYGIPWEVVAYINNFATHGIAPDHTFLLDVDVEVGIARTRKAKGVDVNHFDRAATANFNKRRKGYLELAKVLPNWVVIDANQTEEKVLADIIEATRKNKILGNHKF